MRILVFSDSHKNVSSCLAVIDNIINVDMILHAGDYADDALWISKCHPDIPVKYVPGNCDAAISSPELIIEAEGKRILLTHGHLHMVKMESDYETLIGHAMDEKCDCVVFGHTHKSECFTKKNLTVLNPGSIKSSGSYGVIEIEDGKLRADVCYAPFAP